jgi:hypothetical protein
MSRSAADQLEYERAVKNARHKLQFILDNESALLRVRNGRKKLDDAIDFWDRIERGDDMTPGMISYIDGIYEKTCQGLGLPHMNVHIDKKRKGLRYG